MTWLTRVRIPSSAARAFGHISGRWELDDLANVWAQQRALARLCNGLPQLRGLLDTVITAIGRSGAALVEGLPIRNTVLVLVASALGEVTTEGNGPSPGQLVRDLLATEYSPAPLPLHTDSVFTDRPHAYLGLACVRQSRDGSGCSLLARALDIAVTLQSESPDLVRLLQDPCYPFAKTRAEGPNQSVVTTRFAPILGIVNGDITVCFHGEHLREGLQLAPHALDPQHRIALHAFEDVLRRPSIATTVLLRPGDLLLLNNLRTLHGRTAIGPNGNTRHLKRVKIHHAGTAHGQVH